MRRCNASCERRGSRLRGSIDEQVAERLKSARATIADEEAKKARLALADDLDKKSRENVELQEIIRQRDAKLTEAATAQAEALRKQRTLDIARCGVDLVEQLFVLGKLANEGEYQIQIGVLGGPDDKTRAHTATAAAMWGWA